MVAGGMRRHACKAAHSCWWPFFHAALCASLETYLANLQPVHLPQIAAFRLLTHEVFLQRHSSDSPEKFWAAGEGMMAVVAALVARQHTLVCIFRQDDLTRPKGLYSFTIPLTDSIKTNATSRH